MNRYRVTFIVLLLLSVSACTQQGPAPYAGRYVAALERHPGVQPASNAPIEAFVAFFSSHDRVTGPSAATLYAPELYFSDTLLTSETHAEVVAHLERMRDGAGDLAVTVIDQQIDGADVYLIWRMYARFKPISRTVESDTIGMTHLRFDAEGRIVLQQDFWDSTEGFYRHLPFIGALVSSVARRFDSED
jgi:hypothetical protein